MLLMSLCGVEGWWRGGVHSHFHVQPKCSVEVVLCCHWGCDKMAKFWLYLDSEYCYAVMFLFKLI